MACWEDVPVVGPLFDPEDPDEQVWVRESIEDITVWNSTRRLLHNKDGYFADFAFGPDCLALGHVFDESYEETGIDPYYESGEHVPGWDGENICKETRYGEACTYCESDHCEYELSNCDIWEYVSYERVKSNGR